MKLEDTNEFALVDALLFWADKRSAREILALILTGNVIPNDLANKAREFIYRHPVIDSLEQDMAIEMLDKWRESA